MEISKRLAMQLIAELELAAFNHDQEYGDCRPRWKLVDDAKMSFAYYELIKPAGVDVDKRVAKLKREGL